MVKAKWWQAGCAAATVAILVTGCSSARGGGGASGIISASTMSAMNSLSFGPPEKATINVGAVPAMDSAGFFIALREGLFAKEGLKVNYTPETSSETAIGEQNAGKLDITAGNYVSYIQAAMNGTPLEVISEASVMKPGTQVLFSLPNSGITTLGQLQGHMVGVNAPKNIEYLLAASVLQGKGIGSGVSFPDKPIPLPRMGRLLRSREISAAVLPEPFAAEAEQQLGAVPLADLDQGVAQTFPIGAYVATRQWTRQNPNTLGRFLAALEAGQETAGSNRAAVESAFEGLNGPRDGQVSPQVASVMALDSYPLGLDPARAQRVSNLMYESGLEPGQKQPFDVQSMIMPSGTFDFTPFIASESSSS